MSEKNAVDLAIEVEAVDKSDDYLGGLAPEGAEIFHNQCGPPGGEGGT